MKIKKMLMLMLAFTILIICSLGVKVYASGPYYHSMMINNQYGIWTYQLNDSTGEISYLKWKTYDGKTITYTEQETNNGQQVFYRDVNDSRYIERITSNAIKDGATTDIIQWVYASDQNGNKYSAIRSNNGSSIDVVYMESDEGSTKYQKSGSSWVPMSDADKFATFEESTVLKWSTSKSSPSTVSNSSSSSTSTSTSGTTGNSTSSGSSMIPYASQEAYNAAQNQNNGTTAWNNFTNNNQSGLYNPGAPFQNKQEQATQTLATVTGQTTEQVEENIQTAINARVYNTSDSSSYSESHGKINPDDYKTTPSIEDGEATRLVSSILGIINIFGVVILFGTIIVLGIKYMIGSVEQRADYKHTMIPILIGAFMLFGITSIINFVYNMVSNINDSAPTQEETYVQGAPTIEITEQSQYNEGKERAINWMSTGHDEEEIDAEIERATKNRNKAAEHLEKTTEAYWEGYLRGLNYF